MAEGSTLLRSPTDLSVSTQSVPTQPLPHEEWVELEAMSLSGWLHCAQETLRYLIDVERLPDSHPAVMALRQHLVEKQMQRLLSLLEATEGPMECDLSDCL